MQVYECFLKGESIGFFNSNTRWFFKWNYWQSRSRRRWSFNSFSDVFYEFFTPKRLCDKFDIFHSYRSYFGNNLFKTKAN